ncbi:fibronectin type III domain-containing protein [candidate division KSB1 bacterium]|nr:fibronectin type III domain-containing protein [candidate division KSB1 bacterium]
MGRFSLIWLAIIFTALFGCSRRIADSPYENQPPETHVFLDPDSSLNSTSSIQVIYWSGDDKDGLVKGFYYIWEGGAIDSEWVWTTENSDTFHLRFLGDSALFTFRIKAMDDDLLTDPTPAQLVFPVHNTLPEIKFPPLCDVPETTFTVASFFWEGHDFDGEETIQKYQYVLEDTSNPSLYVDILPDTTFVTLTEADGLTPNQSHVFYVRAVDLAGAASPFIRMPRDTNGVWYVREPKGDYLIIDDYKTEDGSGEFYRSLLDSLVGPGNYSVWDIKRDEDGTGGPDLLPYFPYSEQIVFNFTESIKLFDRIMWYADDDPNLSLAKGGLPQFKASGGKVLFTTAFSENFTNLGNLSVFSPVDSMGTLVDSMGNRIPDIWPPAVILPDSLYADTFDNLMVGTFFPWPYSAIPKPSASVLYRLQASSRWVGQPPLAVIDAGNTFYFFSVPLHKVDGLGTVDDLLSQIFFLEFGEP